MYFDQYLAIDYGSTFIKGVLFKHMLGSVVILRHESLKIVSLDESKADEYEYNIVRFIQSFFPEETNFLINIPVDKLFIRDLVVPLGNEKAVKEVIPFEVENHIPFPIETIVAQGSIWNMEKESSNVITFSAHHDEIENSAKPFLRGDVQLNCISTDPFALSSIMNYHYGKGMVHEIVGQLDIGGKVSIFNICNKGLLRHSRFFNGIGQTITEKIASLLNIEEHEAEEFKHSMHFHIRDAKEEEKELFCKKFHIQLEALERILKYIINAFDGIANEIAKSLNTLNPEDKPEAIYISGGNSLFKGTEDIFYEKLDIQVKRYDFLEISDDSYVNCLGIGYHYRLKKNLRIDFLTPEFSKKINKNQIKLENYKVHLILMAISITILLSVFFVGIVIDKRKIEANNVLLREKFKQGFGREISEDSDPLVEAGKEVKKEQNKTEIVRKFLGQESILDLILDLTQNFPTKENLDFILDQFTFDGNDLSIYGRVNEFTDLGTLEASLKNSKKFKNIDIQNKNLITGVTRYKVRFKIKMEVILSGETIKQTKGKDDVE